VLNLFNLLPVEPLDGGVALRSIFARLLGRHLHYGLASVGLLILAAGWFVREPLLFIFGGLSIAANLRPRRIDQGLVPLSTLQVAISLFGFVAIAAAYVTALGVLMVRIGAG
jgi:Zn-dependent protease